jgi:UDP-N-acetylmuramoylalanine--D-glutamate ligase
MLEITKYKNKKIAIYGMGKSGCSTAKKLNKLGANVLCWDDSQKIRKEIKRYKFNISKFWLGSKKSLIDYIVLSPGIDINKCKIKSYLIKNLKKIITDLDIFFEINKKALIISITGTNGKSTTCKIIEQIMKTAGFKTNVGGNIGKPVLSLNKIKKKGIFILEVSSYQLQYSKHFRSKHAAILNISPDHLERHKSIADYAKIKTKIFIAQQKNDYSYVSSSNKYSKLICNNLKIKSKLIKVDKKYCNSLLKKINNKYLHNEGNQENVSFAYKIAKNFKLKNSVIIKALNSFKGLPHRQEIVFSNKKNICINDSKATSFDASLQSLKNYNKIYWIVGGLSKYKDHFNLNEVSKNIIKAYIIGKETNFFSKQLKNKIPYTTSYNLKNAINNIYDDINRNNQEYFTILFSPAAASYDQFNNFENRGLYFKNLIKKKMKKI